MAILEDLYQGRGIRPGTSLEKVQQVQNLLVVRLHEQLDTPYVWNAFAYRAVMAGWWGGERRRKRRLKLLALINECQRYLGKPEFQLPENWELENLYYGFDAVSRLSRETGVPTSKLALLAVLRGASPAALIQGMTDGEL